MYPDVVSIDKITPAISCNYLLPFMSLTPFYEKLFSLKIEPVYLISDGIISFAKEG